MGVFFHIGGVSASLAGPAGPEVLLAAGHLTCYHFTMLKETTGERGKACYTWEDGGAEVVNDKLRRPETDRLFAAILSLQNSDECYRFFEDLCTVAELKELSQRLEVARLLAEGATYQEIVGRTGASTATVSRVKRALEYGADGYKAVLSRLSARSEVR